MLVIRNLVLVHKVKSKEAVSSAYAERGAGGSSVQVYTDSGDPLLLFPNIII